MSPTTIPALLMAFLSLGCIVLVLIGLRQSLKRTRWTESHQTSYFRKSILIVSLWVIVLSILAWTGFFKTFGLPPRAVWVILVAFVLLLILSSSKNFPALLSATPVHWLVLMQSFRVLVEVLLFMAYRRQLLPVQMTWEGNNYDLLTGILALPVGWWIAKNPIKAKWPGIFFNIFGLILLLNVLIVAVLSMPTAIRYFKNEPPLSIIGEFPFIYLPGILVVLALALHIFSLKQLIKGKTKQKEIRKTKDVPVGIEE